VQFAARLRQAGVPVELLIGAGHLHGTPGITASFSGAREWQQEHARQLALAYRTHPVPIAD
jgi:acetyl esterase